MQHIRRKKSKTKTRHFHSALFLRKMGGGYYIAEYQQFTLQTENNCKISSSNLSPRRTLRFLTTSSEDTARHSRMTPIEYPSERSRQRWISSALRRLFCLTASSRRFVMTLTKHLSSTSTSCSRSLTVKEGISLLRSSLNCCRRVAQRSFLNRATLLERLSR